MTTPLPRRVQTYVFALAGLSLAVLIANVSSLAAAPPPPTMGTGALALAFLAGFIALERLAITLRWRSHLLRTSFVETAVYLGFAFLAPGLVVALVPLAFVAIHVWTRRPPVKGVFNIAHGTVAAFVASVTFQSTLTLGAPAFLAAAIAAATYSVSSEFLLAALFALLEGVDAGRVYAERLYMANTVAIAIGVPAGMAVHGLATLHPFAVLAAAPLAILLQRHGTLIAAADRELSLRRRLADDGRDLIGARDDGEVARRILLATRDLLDARRVRMRLVSGETWEDADDPTASDAPTRPPIEASITGRDGILLGTLAAWQRPAKGAYREEDHELLNILASKAAHALESAHAITEVAAQRDLIARQEKLSSLGTMMAGVAHEIGNPLSYMRLRTGILRTDITKVMENDPTPDARILAERTAKHLDVIERGVDRLGTLAHSLKVVARPGDGARQPTDVNDVVGQVLTILQAGHKEVTFQMDFAQGLPPAMANAHELHQVILNLLKNASEALDGTRGPTVRVATRQENGAIVISVADNGPGIPTEVQTRLFTPFYTTKKAGTGLGLSISHQIVAAHGGELRFESAPGKGTTFLVRLPVAP